MRHHISSSAFSEAVYHSVAYSQARWRFGIQPGTKAKGSGGATGHIAETTLVYRSFCVVVCCRGSNRTGK